MMQFPKSISPASINNRNHLYLIDISQNVPISPIDHNNEADQNPNTYKYVLYIYTHMYSVYSMMVCAYLLHVYVCPTTEDLRKGFLWYCWVTHVFVQHQVSVLFPSLPASYPSYPHLLFITTIPCCRLRQRTSHWFSITQALKAAL